jgi:hypothetical protein
MSALLMMALSAFLLPYAITTYAPQWLKEKTGRELSVAEASFNPVTLQLIVNGVALKDEGRTLAAFDELNVKGSWSSITNAAWTTDSITLTKPQISAHSDVSGTLDWVRFIEAASKTDKPAAPSDSLPRIVLNNITVTDAALRLTDERVRVSETGQKRIELAPLTFKLNKLSTLPRDRGDYALDAILNDQTRIRWTGRVGANPIESSGDVAISNFPLAKISSLANIQLPAALQGVAAFKANYTAAIGSDFVAFGIGNGELRVDNFNATQGDDVASLGQAIVSPLSVSFARTELHSKQIQTAFAVEPMKATIKGIQLGTKASTKPLLSASELVTSSPIKVDVSSSKISIPSIQLTNLIAQLNRANTGEVDFPFTRTPQPAKPTPLPSTQPVKSESTTAPWRIELGELDVSLAKATFIDASLSSPQTITANVDVKLGATATLGETPKFSLSSKSFRVSELSLRDNTTGASNAAPWFSVKEIRAQPFEFASDAKKIELPRIEVIAPQLAVTLANDGVDLAKKLSPAVAPAAARKVNAAAHVTAANKDALQISLASVALNGGRVVLNDATLPTPLAHTLQEIRVNIERFVINGAAPVNAAINAALASGGTLQTQLKYDMRRNGVDATVALEKLALAPLSPYINRNTKLKIAKGEAAVSGKLVATTATSESTSFNGKAALRDVDLTDETTNASFAQWGELSTTGAKVTVGSNGTQIALADLLLDQPRGKIIIGEDRSVNLTQIAKLDASGQPVAQAQKPAQAAPTPVDASSAVKASVARIQVTGGDIEFADLSLRPQFGTRVSDLSGLVVGLSTDSSSRAEISMEGKVDQFGLARLTGTIAPFGATEFTDLKAVFRNLELANLTPYSGKFAGRKIESGKLSLDLDYKIVARKLKGENQVIIDNIKLGERVDSPDATSLPLDLAIALMRDSNGVIDLGIPVQGSLDDPQFSYGSLIWKAIVNVLTKVATAPFRALGALLGGSGEEFEAVIFEPGEARLLPPEREKLAKLASALEKRPALKLTIEPRFDKTADRDALADNILKLEIGKRAGLKPPGPNEPLIISFTDQKVQAALDELAASDGEDAAKLRAKYLPPASNAITGLIQNARERVTEKGRNEAAEARGKYYPELFALLKSKQSVPDFAFEALATLRGQAIQNTLTGVNKFDAARVSLAAPSAAKNVKAGQVPTQLALSAK